MTEYSFKSQGPFWFKNTKCRWDQCLSPGRQGSYASFPQIALVMLFLSSIIIVYFASFHLRSGISKWLFYILIAGLRIGWLRVNLFLRNCRKNFSATSCSTFSSGDLTMANQSVYFYDYSSSDKPSSTSWRMSTQSFPMLCTRTAGWWMLSLPRVKPHNCSNWLTSTDQLVLRTRYLFLCSLGEIAACKHVSYSHFLFVDRYLMDNLCMSFVELPRLALISGHWYWSTWFCVL